jgi:hypothetical protein
MATKSTHGGPHDAEDTKIIRTFSNHEQADLASANLQAHGIESWITADDGGGMLPNLASAGGVRLSVRASEAEAALALIEPA